MSKLEMTNKDIWYGDVTRVLQKGSFHVPYSSSSFDPSGTVHPSAPTIVEAIPIPSSETEQRPSNSAIIIGCGIVGWAVAGSWAAVLVAIGGKYAADQNHSPIGDVARAVGRIASAAGKKAREERLLCKLKTTVESIIGKKGCHCKVCDDKGASSK